MKKIAGHINRTYKKTFTRTDGKNEPEDHHIAGIVMIILFILVLMATLVFFLVEKDKQNKEVIQDLLIMSEPMDFTSIYLSFPEFSKVVGYEIRNLDNLERYFFEAEFEEITREGSILIAKKGAGCYQDFLAKGLVCRVVTVSYDTSQSKLIEFGVERWLEG